MPEKTHKYYENEVEKLFDLDLNQITKKKISEIFPNFNDLYGEDKYSPIHFIADNSSDPKKASKAISILFENDFNGNKGCNPNYNDVDGGYSFIHLALYSDFKLDFFKEIIPVAKRYGFDVNIKDEDGDSILHTAIYSEDYFDPILPLFKLVEDDFDFSCTNEEGKTLMDALYDAIEEARKPGRKAWLYHLLTEKDEIEKFLHSKGQSKIKKRSPLQNDKNDSKQVSERRNINKGMEESFLDYILADLERDEVELPKFFQSKNKSEDTPQMDSVNNKNNSKQMAIKKDERSDINRKEVRDSSDVADQEESSKKEEIKSSSKENMNLTIACHPNDKFAEPTTNHDISTEVEQKNKVKDVPQEDSDDNKNHSKQMAIKKDERSDINRKEVRDSSDVANQEESSKKEEIKSSSKETMNSTIACQSNEKLVEPTTNHDISTKVGQKNKSEGNKVGANNDKDLLNQLKSKISDASTLDDLNNLLQVAQEIKDHNYRNDIINELNKRKNYAERIVFSVYRKEELVKILLHKFPGNTDLISIQNDLPINLFNVSVEDIKKHADGLDNHLREIITSLIESITKTINQEIDNLYFIKDLFDDVDIPEYSSRATPDVKNTLKLKQKK